MSLRHTTRQLSPILGLLLTGFFLRTHLLTGFPAYIDEYRHIARAQIVFTTGQKPIEFSHGKLLLYYWLGLFQPQGTSALFVSRFALALTLLIAGAAVASIARQLFGQRAVIPALAVFTFAPYGLFYQRMALADSFAGALAALAIWLTLRLLRHPIRSTGVALGLMLALATLAKLTAAPIIALPLVAVALLGGTSAGRRDPAAAWARYRTALIAAGLAFAALWALVGATALADLLAGGRPLLLDQQLLTLDATTAAESLLDKLGQWVETLVLLLSTPGAILLPGLVLAGLWERTRPIAFVMAWMALLWGPCIVLADLFEGRYLMIGMSALAVLAGGGFAAFTTSLERLRFGELLARALTAATLIAWIGIFALPRAWTLVVHPAEADVTAHDTYLYFSSPSNAWGIAEVFDYLSAQRQHTQDSVPVTALLVAENGVEEFCGLAALYVSDGMRWSCMSQVDFPDTAIPVRVSEWPTVMAALNSAPYIYVLTNALPDDQQPLDTQTDWELVLAPERPYGGPRMLLWRVSSVAPDVVADISADR
ncbi:ArnT family glycosyltransferase [Aggregatilinea lenta]|uniref:ArnT family glycosyltransferase n=1 Tax=Aggregatilinea lenta TaxID=913108 RepID=UPI0013C35B42|nr:glycosyltransferase family 39 protein [Aggregatilinea lenta]